MSSAAEVEEMGGVDMLPTCSSGCTYNNSSSSSISSSGSSSSNLETQPCECRKIATLETEGHKEHGVRRMDGGVEHGTGCGTSPEKEGTPNYVPSGASNSNISNQEKVEGACRGSEGNKLPVEQQQPQEERGDGGGDKGRRRRFGKQRQEEDKEEEEEEEEEEEKEEEEEEEEEDKGDRSGEWTAWSDEDGDRSEASRDNDGFLDEFVRELDGASSCAGDDDGEDDSGSDQIEGREEGAGGKGGDDGDEQVARALQDEEWRRNLPPLPGMFRSCLLPSDDGHGRRISSVIGSESRSSSIFYLGGARASSSESTSIFGLVSNPKTDDNGNSSGAAGAGAAGAGAAGAAAARAAASCGGESSSRMRFNGADVDAEWAVAAAVGHQGDDDDGNAHDRPWPSAAKRGRGTSACSNMFRRESEAAAGGRKSKVKAGVRAGTPAAWPPGGLGEGEGLRINNLPDEIVDNIAGFALLPRCVSKRIERYRVKVVRKRVIGALESSAKLPALKAQEVEDAIFVLCGRCVTKAYKAKAREMSFNLRAGKNDPLRERLLSGFLLPSELVRMSSNDLAPLSVRQERERLVRKRIREVTSSRDSPFHTVTDRFTCQECGHERTQYRTWRRKAVVDRVRVIVQCLQCRHSWEL